MFSIFIRSKINVDKASWFDETDSLDYEPVQTKQFIWLSERHFRIFLRAQIGFQLMFRFVLFFWAVFLYVLSLLQINLFKFCGHNTRAQI